MSEEGLVSISHDVHVSGCDTDIWSDYVDSGSDETLLTELHGVSPDKSGDLVLGVGSWVDSESSFGSTIWNVDDGQLDTHKSSEGLNFVKIYFFGHSHTTLSWSSMVLMLASVGWDHFYFSVVSHERDVEFDAHIWFFDDVYHVIWDSRFFNRNIEVLGNHLEEIGFAVDEAERSEELLLGSTLF